MRKLAFALIAMGAMAFASTANAAVTTTGPVITGDSGSYTGHVTCATTCAFSTIIDFTAPAGYNLQSIDISSNYTNPNKKANIDFTSVMLNGVELNIDSTGQQEFRHLFDQVLLPGTNMISISGNAGVGAVRADATFSGVLSFAAAVPEPGTWAMMLLGFGAVGMGMRRRSRVLRPQVA